MLVVLGSATSRRSRSTAATTISSASGNQAVRLRRAPAARQPSPPPRNVASRMKFEKYASSRTYAGIQRMSAISRNRTRNDETNSDIRSRILDAEFGQRLARAAVPLVDEDIALILQIGDAELARPEAARRQVAEAGEERDRVR